MKSLNTQQINTQSAQIKIEEKNLVRSLDIISPYNEDPFLGHIMTPITGSKIVRSYLEFLPAYKYEMSPLLRGLNIGFAHGYFLFGPFAKLGPLRTTEASNFAGFISTISIIILLTAGLLIYGYVTFKAQKTKNVSNRSLTFLSAGGWYQMGAGFTLGGFGGAGVAYVLVNYFADTFIRI